VNDPLTYVYCLVRSPRRPLLKNLPPAMPGANEIRALHAGHGLWVIASHVPVRDYNESALSNGLQHLDWVGPRAIAHEAVVEHFLGAPSVLPMQLFTLFTSDERALAHVARDRSRLDRVLTRIERQLEWGLRLTFDATTDAADAGTKTRSKAGRRAGSTESGAEYLSRKRALIGVTRARLVRARAEGDRLYRAMAREASAALRRTTTEEASPGSKLLVDAAFLVPVRRAVSFRAALRKQAKKLEASGLVVSLTGPWPPYNFIDARPRSRRS
jgi:hypothetical protein